MTKNILLTPTGKGVGLTTVALGLIRAIETQGIRARLFKPISMQEERGAIPLSRAKHLLTQNKQDELMDMILSQLESIQDETDVVILLGLPSTSEETITHQLNINMSEALDAKVIFLASASESKPSETIERIIVTMKQFGEHNTHRALGYIINKITLDKALEHELNIADKMNNSHFAQSYHIAGLSLLGLIPHHPILLQPRVKDVANYIHADIVAPGDMDNRRVSDITLCARGAENIISILTPGKLIVTAGDRTDILLTVCMAALNGVKLAGLLLTGGYTLSETVKAFCQKAIETGLPLLSVPQNSFETTIRLQNMPNVIAEDDEERFHWVKDYVANFISIQPIQTVLTETYEARLTPAAFMHQLIKKARLENKRIVLPEGNEPRTIEAASICAARGIARCVLLGDEALIREQAKNNGIELNGDVDIIEPETIREKYVESLVALRKHKGMEAVVAREQLEDNVMLGTMMLHEGEVDGLVSGAIHTTANTIRPAFQIIKTKRDAALVSSIFFMCLPTQVLVYGDCAVNPDPTEEQLADIAIQSAESAKMFGIEPRVAMISYSTGASGVGSDVDKVRKATDIVKSKRPDIVIDGPLQYDAALIESVAKSKAPNSPVAGKATVFIFPDLNTGNTTYKAVQRSASVLSIGPMLQGLNKPVNDLSRGALVNDIVFTIALTAIQAG